MYGIRKRDGSHDHLALDNEFIARGNAQRISLSALIFLKYFLYKTRRRCIFGGHDRERTLASTRALEKLDRNKVLKNNNIYTIKSRIP